MRLKHVLFICIGFCLSSVAFGQQGDYSTNAEIAQRLTALSTTAPQLVTHKTLTNTAGGNPIHALEIGTKKDNPAIAIIGGSDGSHLLGVEMALGFAEHIVRDRTVDSVATILASTTFYILPNVSPDAYAQYFANLKYERVTNTRSTDNDRDGRIDEDGYEDLNGDGLITMLRIKHPAGTHIMHPADSRIMIEADATKGESGIYLMVEEGIDNDKDKKFNEDGPGGVAFNSNLTYEYPNFKKNAGSHPVSEPETQAVLDYLYDKWNVFAVLNFGYGDNLSSANKFSKPNATKRVVSSWLEKDVAVNEMVASWYGKHVKTKNWDAHSGEPGDLFQWAYYHYGRLSFSTPGWWPSKFEMPKDSLEAAKYIENKDENYDVDFLRWAEANDQDIFVPWTAVKHPDYPNRAVEVGGFKPFVWDNPTKTQADSVVNKHSSFVLQFAQNKAALEVQDIKVDKLGNNVYRLTLTVFNKGAMPTMSALGSRNQWVKRVKAALKLNSSQELISGNAIQFLPMMNQTDTKELTWLVRGNGNVNLEIGAPHVGITTLESQLN